MSKEKQKQEAAVAALTLVEDGMTLGLGTGSTAAFFVKALGERVRNGLNVRGVPTSEQTRALAEKEGIALTNLGDAGRLDLTVDGADEVDMSFRLIKGGGGALLREKIVASASDKVAIIVDAEKCVDHLGSFPLPIEIVPFGARVTERRIGELLGVYGQGEVTLGLRADQFGEPYVTDSEHMIIDAAFNQLTNIEGLVSSLDSMTGVVDHGLFINLCDTLIIGSDNGVEMLQKS